jgi:hypothetical protein
MPRYIYECLDCLKKIIDSDPNCFLPDKTDEIKPELYETLVLFETSHAMEPTKQELAEALICPRCQGDNCKRSFHGTQIHSYILGYGYCDKAGAKRDMDIYTLKNDDPYKEHRVPGEVEEIENRIKKSAKPKQKHFDVGSANDKN